MSTAIRRTLIACALALAALVTTGPALAHNGPSTELLLGPGRVPDADLPRQAMNGTGLNGDFNAAALGAHWIRLRMPDGSVRDAERRRLVNKAQLGQSWIGELEGQPGSIVTITRYRGVITGFVHDGADIYEIFPGRSGRQLFYKLDPARLPRVQEPLKLPQASGATLDGTSAVTGAVAVTTAGNAIQQDLLVVYTQASVNANGGEATLRSRIIDAVNLANAAYANSQVNISLNIVGMALTQYTETGDMGAALAALQSPNDGRMDEVHKLRDQYGADIVSLIDEDSNYCGIGYVMSSVGTGFAPNAFNVVLSSCLTNHSLAHEIGHNQGDLHDRASTSGTGAYPYSYGYRRCVDDGYGFRTVMSYSCTGGPRVAYFSNPNVYLNGYPTGIDYGSDPANSADNARSMNNTASAVASFRSGAVSSPPAAPTGLAATSVTSGSVSLAWIDNAINESGYNVWRSTNGGTFANVATLGAGAVSYTDTAVAGSTNYQYFVNATNAAGTSVNSNTVSVSTPAPTPPPGVPTSVSASVGGSTVSIIWVDGSTNETGFEVRRETYNSRKSTWGSATTIATRSSTSSSAVGGQYTQADAPGAGTYRYSVRAVNSGGASLWVLQLQTGGVTVASSTKKGAGVR